MSRFNSSTFAVHTDLGSVFLVPNMENGHRHHIRWSHKGSVFRILSLDCACFHIPLQHEVCNLLIICIFCFYSVCDYLGERLASLLGITTPKYQYAIDEYYRMKKEVRGRRPRSHPSTYVCNTQQTHP